MLRYFKRNLGLAVLALGISILARLSTPVVAMMEQQMIDRIIQGDLTGFYHQLFYKWNDSAPANLYLFHDAETCESGDQCAFDIAVCSSIASAGDCQPASGKRQARAGEKGGLSQ